MVAFLPAVLLVLFPQDLPAPRPPALSVEWGLLAPDGSLSPAALGLGTGGFPPHPAGEEALVRVRGRGRAATPGGAEVEVRAEGCHVRFPSGARLLLDGRARIHRPDGRATLAAFHGVALHLADGSHLVVRPSPGRGWAPGEVVLGFRGEHVQLWSDGRPAARLVDLPRLPALSFMALGEGGTLYTAVNLAVALVLEQALAGPEEPMPPRRVVFLGDVLRAACGELPARAPRRSVQFPDAGLRAGLAADIAEAAFPSAHPGAAEAAVVAGEGLVLPLRRGSVLRARLSGPSGGGAPRLAVSLALVGEQAEEVLAEAFVGPGRPLLHQVHRSMLPATGRPRHVHDGIDLSDAASSLGAWCPWPPPAADRQRAFALLREMRVGLE